jgi:hypothetical protein
LDKKGGKLDNRDGKSRRKSEKSGGYLKNLSTMASK